ncbi:Flagellar protein FliT [Enterobacter cancerogenus]|uniref:flagellar protein FliT n=1 Tax=Enterobacter cancerogenus TaxID=69218 RepID=UPI001926A3E6|nr:flagellar protein FliT [Enterobacter cancerogenus]CAD5358436.1 Flagellar protein FliT [Enterobacter cancerogenus]
MTDTPTKEYEHIYQLNQNMLEMVRLGEWQAFIEQASNYIINLQKVLDEHPLESVPEERDGIAEILQKLIDNENEMTRGLEHRLDVLRQDISKLNNGKKCNQAYAAHFTNSLQ